MMNDAELIESLRGFFPDFFNGRDMSRTEAHVVLDQLTDWIEHQVAEDQWTRDARAAALDDVYFDSRRIADRMNADR